MRGMGRGGGRDARLCSVVSQSLSPRQRESHEKGTKKQKRDAKAKCRQKRRHLKRKTKKNVKNSTWTSIDHGVRDTGELALHIDTKTTASDQLSCL